MSLRALKVDFKTHDLNMIEGMSNIVLIYKIYFKVMNIIFFQTLIWIKDKRDETMLFQTNIVKFRSVVPKIVLWDKISLLEYWCLNQDQQSSVPQIRN